MFFTQEDYRKIEKWLTANSRKDTDFVGAATPLKGNETVVLVQNGKNVKTSVEDIVDQFFLLGVSDFLNITDKYGEKNITINQAIQLIPFRSRKIGQVITFIDEYGNWAIYQFQGKALNQWNNTTLWINILGSIVVSDVVPDEEDITGVKDGDKLILKFANKKYNPEQWSGLGRTYLRKNVTTVIDSNTGKRRVTNLLSQDMIPTEDTIYILQYDYDLNGQTITVPNNRIILFEGGSISNGTLHFNNTTLAGNPNIVADITGTVANNKVYPEWFGAKLDGFTDDSTVWNKLLMWQKSNNFSIILCGDTYIGNTINSDSYKVNIKGETVKESRFIIDTNIQVFSIIPTVNDLTTGNITLKDFSVVNKNYQTIRVGSAIYLKGVHSSNISNIEFWGLTNGVTLEECTFNDLINLRFQSVTNSIGIVSWSNSNRMLGGLIRESSVLEGISNFSFNKVNFEPVTKSIVIGSNCVFTECRFERFHYGQSFFSWFNITGDNNIIDKTCQWHWNGITIPSDSLIIISGKDNDISIMNPYTRSNLVKFTDTAINNRIFIGDSDPYNNTGRNPLYSGFVSPISNSSFMENNLVELGNGSTSVAMSFPNTYVTNGNIDIIGNSGSETYENCSIIEDGYDGFKRFKTIQTTVEGNVVSRYTINTKKTATVRGYYSLSVLLSIDSRASVGLSFTLGAPITSLDAGTYIITFSQYKEIGDPINFILDCFGGTKATLVAPTISAGLYPVLYDSPIDTVLEETSLIESGGLYINTDGTLTSKVVIV